MSAVKSVFVGACGLLLLAGCGGGTQANTLTTAAPAATATQSPSSATTNSGSALASAEEQSYADATGREDNPDAMREALKLTAPNSVAYVYLDHEANVAEASLDGGHQLPKVELAPVSDGSFTACDPTDATNCVTFGGFKLNPAGKLVDLTVNKQQIGPRITAGNGQAVTAGGTKFTFLTAYKSVQSPLCQSCVRHPGLRVWLVGHDWRLNVISSNSSIEETGEAIPEAVVPDPAPRPVRRSFTAAYRLAVVAEYESAPTANSEPLQIPLG